MRNSFKLSVVLCLSYTVVMSVIFYGGAQGIFTDIYRGRAAFAALRMGAAAVCDRRNHLPGRRFAASSPLWRWGRRKISLILACLRKIILLVPLIYIMPAAFGGLESAARLAAPVADLVRQPGPVATIFWRSPSPTCWRRFAPP